MSRVTNSMHSNGTAVITGASSGIGEAFARRLAARRFSLVFVARRRELLEALADRLRGRYAVEVEVLPADLAQLDEIKRVEARVAELRELTMVINNAGFGTPGTFAGSDLEREMDMVNVHVTATMRLTRAALPAMIKRRGGAIINVSSVSAFFPVPGSASYSASKVYGVNFSQALQAELIGTGVCVQALCPGFTHTGFHGTPEYKQVDMSGVPRWLWMSSDAVVAESLRALRRGHTVCIPGLKNRLIVAVAGHRFAAPLVEAVVRRQRRRKRTAA